MNLLGPGQTADYIDTGTWADKAIKEAKRVGTTANGSRLTTARRPRKSSKRFNGDDVTTCRRSR